MKEDSGVKVRKTCGNCDKVDHKHSMCTKSGNFVNMGKGRPNCKNWKLEEVVIKPIATAEPSAEVKEQVKDIQDKAEASTAVPVGYIPDEAQKKPETIVKDHPMRRFLKKIGIIGK